MKIRLISVVLGVTALLGLGVAPASAAPTTEACPLVLYPYCG